MLPVLYVMRELHKKAYRRMIMGVWNETKETGSLICNTAYPDRRFRIRRKTKQYL